MPPAASLLLENSSGHNVIEVYEVEPSDSWIQIDWKGFQCPFSLKPGAKLELRCRVLPAQLRRDSYTRGQIVIRSNVGEDKLFVDVTPALDVAISSFDNNTYKTPCEFEIVLDGRPLEENLIQVRLKKGVGVLKGVDCDAPQYISVRTISGEPFPLHMDSRTPQRATVELKLDVDELKLMRENTPCPSDKTVGLTFDFDEEVCRSDVTLHFWQVPKLQIPDEFDYSIQAMAGRNAEIVLTLQNRSSLGMGDDRGNCPLVVTAVEITSRRLGQDLVGAATARVPNFLVPDAKMQFPVTIPGGGEAKLIYRFSTREGEDDGGPVLGLGTYAVVLELITNYQDVSRKVDKEIRVERLPAFEGVLAIDFGTSNSCVAFFRETDRRRGLVRVNDNTTTPTVLQYRRPAEPAAGHAAEVRVGTRVVTTIYTPKNIRSIVRSPKLRLGEAGHSGTFEVAYFETDDVHRLRARQVAADFLRELRDTAQDQLRARFKRIVFTHPSDFEPRQIQDLKAAMQEVFGRDCYLETLPEPVAAGLTHMLSEELLHRDRYTLAVFDFGGGTTDISLLEVENRRIGDRIEIHPRQVGFNGHQFGGQNLTGFIEEWAWKRCLEFISADERGATLPRGRELKDPTARLMAMTNNHRLFEWAEQVKLGIIEYDKQFFEQFPASSPEDFPNLALQIQTPTGPKLKTFGGREICPPVQEFQGWLRKQLKTLAEDLKTLSKAAGTEQPDYIKLSGKSSKIPLVFEVVSESFPQSAVQLSDEPKQCVVEGACVPYVLSFTEDMVLILDGTTSGFVRTTRRIGYERIKGGLTPFFQMIFDRGVPIPESGLTEERRNYLIRPGTQLKILQNASTSDDTVEGNSNIKDLGVYVPDPNILHLNPGEMLDANLRFGLSPSFDLTITSILKDGRTIPFVRRDAANAEG